MSSNSERKSEDEGGSRMIPVFTVIKNGVILKNIFVVNKPPEQFSGFSSIKFVESSENPDHQTEEILIVGRHPDCNIVLMHPSISRFHLQINSNPSLRKLFLTDLSSVHGTWISEKKIDPGFRIEMKEGDTIRMGGSTRLYRLHWIPLSRAYDSENPFVSELDLALLREKEDENIESMSQNEDLLATENKIVEEKDSLAVLEKPEVRNQDIDFCVPKKGEIHTLGSISEDAVSLLPDENFGFILNEEMNSFHGGREERENPSTNDSELSLKSVGGAILQTLSAMFYDCNQSPEYYSAEEDVDFSMMAKLELESRVGTISDSLSSIIEEDSASKITKETRSQSMSRKEKERMVDTLPVRFVQLSMSAGEPSDTCNECVNKENSRNTAENKRLNLQNGSSDDPAAAEVLIETENHSPLRKESLPRKSTIDGTVSTEVLGEIGNLSPLRKEGMPSEERIGDPAAIEVLEETENLGSNRNQGILKEPTIDDRSIIVVLDEAAKLSSYTKEGKLNETTMDDPAAIGVLEEAENQCPLMKDGILTQQTLVSMAHFETERSSNSPVTPKSNFPDIENVEKIMGSCDRSDKRTGSCNIWSRRGKPASALQLQTSRSQRKTRGDDELENQENIDSKSTANDCFSGRKATVEVSPDKENRTPNTSTLRSLKKITESKSITRALFSDIDAMDREVYTPDKENRTPNTSMLRSLKKNTESKSITRELFSDIEAMDKEVYTPEKENRTPSNSVTRSKKKSSFYPEDKQTPAILQEMKSARSSRHHFKLENGIVLKERRAERIPLQSLISNSPVKLSEASIPSPAKPISSSISFNQKVSNSNSVNSVRGGRKRWIMIADTSSLLNKETRGALELLQGLKGTHLIMPRVVIRELDSLKRRNSLFRRKTEASVVLQWIEECMVKNKWWIHVQSSVEESRPIAPTPPATPVSHFREESEVFSFSAPLELVSPTAEDHILDCALFYKKMNNDRHLALLSNNVTLKIKAMAEGVICETAQEFRDSLVNPFSDRFLWADSSPRGQTWSVFDDVVLKEKYYRSPSRKSSRGESAKGLKLILLHNSQFVKSKSRT